LSVTGPIADLSHAPGFNNRQWPLNLIQILEHFAEGNLSLRKLRGSSGIKPRPEHFVSHNHNLKDPPFKQSQHKFDSRRRGFRATQADLGGSRKCPPIAPKKIGS
jgi:hypothetical protein